MLDIYFNDKIDIVKIVKDEWGDETKTLIEDKSCRVEDNNKVVRNKDGQEVMSHSTIITEYTNITYEDKIKIQTINEVEYDLKNKELAIISIENAHSIDNSYKIIYV